MIDLGRNNVNIKRDFEHINYNNLRLMVGSHLVSSDISFYIDDEVDGVREGTVFAGFHSVGKLRITELKNRPVRQHESKKK